MVFKMLIRSLLIRGTVNSMTKEYNRGFTLIELLVVMAIIGILSSVVLVSLSSARDKAKNARIMHDLDQLRTQMEIYQIDHDGYGGYVWDCTNGVYDGNPNAINVFATPEAQGGVKETVDIARNDAAPDSNYYGGFTCATGPYWGSYYGGAVQPTTWAVAVPRFGGGFICYDNVNGMTEIQGQLFMWYGQCGHY